MIRLLRRKKKVCYPSLNRRRRSDIPDDATAITPSKYRCRNGVDSLNVVQLQEPWHSGNWRKQQVSGKTEGKQKYRSDGRNITSISVEVCGSA